MKKLILFALLVLIGSASFAQFGMPYSKSGADAIFVKKTDLIDANPILNAKADISGQAYTGTHNFTGATITAPTKAIGTNTTDVATTAGVLSEISARDDKWVDDLNSIGLGIKLLPIAMQTFFTTSTALVDGTHYQILFRVKKTTTITGVKFNQGATSGIYVADGYNGFGLYSTDGTTNTKITETANDGNLWKGTASTTQTKAFPTPVVLSPGLYYFTFVWNTSDASPTIPTIGSVGSASSAQGGVFNGYKVAMSRAAQSTIPATETISTTTSATVVWGIMPY